MFRVKICGITNVADARLAAEAGADAVGLNFYEGSPRFISECQAEQIVSVLPRGVAKVGLFVNAPLAHIVETFDRLQLDYVQLHGDEGPQLVEQLRGRPTIRAFRIGPQGLQGMVDYLADCRGRKCLPQAVLIDAWQFSIYGGTGRVVDWQSVAQARKLLAADFIILAGGLNADNVSQAIHTARPDAVDVSSGVESQPGQKQPQFVQDFVAAANAAFASIR